MLVAKPWNTVKDDHWVVYADHSAVVRCLDERGRQESALKAQILQAFPTTQKGDLPKPFWAEQTDKV